MQNSQAALHSDVRPLLRSLLQKAVRRGEAHLVDIVACRLAERGDSAWLKIRAGVIAFEECWPYGAKLLNNPPLVSLCEMANLIKDKEAAGLGSLAHALADGDFSVLDGAPDPVAVKIVAASLTRTEEFFSWAEKICHEGERADLLRAARYYFLRASWPWDKAFASAAVYFACFGHSLRVERAPSANGRMLQFPLWIAIDKHTPTGKSALRRVSSKLSLPQSQLEWASFYFESASCNGRHKGPWWEAEMKWRFQQVNLKVNEAQDLWSSARELIRSEVEVGVKLLETALELKKINSL